MPSAVPPLPNFLIIGAQRSGTTSLARYIGGHSDEFVPPEKELHFFDGQFDRGPDWYRAFFADAANATAIGEATAGYLHTPRAIERMADLIPHAHLIAILRQPIDRAYSSYWMHRERGRESLSFVEAIEDGPRRLAAARTDGVEPHRVYVHSSRYAEQLARVCEFYPREALLVLLTDDLADDPIATFGRVCEHVGIDPSERPDRLGEPLNRYVHIRSTKVRAASRAIAHPIGRVIERLNVSKRSYPPINPEVRQHLTAEFESEIAALEAWLGRDLGLWRV